MKSWQSSLKFSFSRLNQNDGTTKLFNPSVVWQGSVVFGEVIFFSNIFFSLLLLFELFRLFKSLNALFKCTSFVIFLLGSSKN